MKNICVIGLGYVGMTLAVSFANKGFRVYGIEINPVILESLKDSKAHFFEPKLNDMIDNNIKAGRFSYHSHYDRVFSCDYFIITIGTPLDNHKKVNLSMILKVTDELSQVINNKSTIILRSTVKIGTTRKIFSQLSESLEFKPKIAFCPERTIEGDAMNEILSLPQIIGGIDEVSSDSAHDLFSKLTTTTVIMSSPEAAEMVKLTDNVTRDIRFAIANEIALSCDHLKLSAHEIIRAAGRDYPRTKLPLPGPVGGPCLEKDTYIYNQSFNNYIPKIAVEARSLNESLIDHALIFIRKKIGISFGKVTVLGMAFKGEPPTNDIRGSMSLKLIEKIKGIDSLCAIHVYDSLATEKEIKSIDNFLNIHKSILDATFESNIVFIMNQNYEFQNLDLNKLFLNMAERGIVYDFWGQLIGSSGYNDNYFAFGSHEIYN